jgi:hypothetical protein
MACGFFAAPRATQFVLGHHQGVLLRAGGQSHLCRDGGVLRHRGRAGTAEKTTRQGSFHCANVWGSAGSGLNAGRSISSNSARRLVQLAVPQLCDDPAHRHLHGHFDLRDYHVEVEKRYYSVPLSQCSVLTSSTMEPLPVVNRRDPRATRSDPRVRRSGAREVPVDPRGRARTTLYGHSLDERFRSQARAPMRL